MTYDSRARDVRRMFEEIAPTYDLLNHLLSLRFDVHWRNWAARKANPSRTSRILDLCGGTGEMAMALAKKAPESQITILDFSGAMLLRAREKAREKEGFTLVAADALHLPFRESSFGLVTCAFGLRNLTELRPALREVFRVLQTGGQFVVLEFMARPRKGLGALLRRYVRHVVPWLGGKVSHHPHAYRYLQESADSYLTSEEMSSRMIEAGFRDLKVQNPMPHVCTLFRAEKA